MKILQLHRPTRRSRAFNLLELQISMGVLAIVLGGAFAAHFFGLRMFYKSRQTVGASQEARIVLGKMREEIRGCTSVMVGSGDHNDFTEVPDNQLQVGNAVQIFPTTNYNNYTIYFRDRDGTMKKWDNTSRNLSVLAHNVTNEFVFAATDYNGNRLTNNVNNRVIEIALKFQQGKNDKNRGSYGGLHDYYQVQTKATRRKIL
jgi:hypothetical protein